MNLLSIEVDHNSKEPMYIQLFRWFQSGIERGDIQAGEKLPSLRELSSQLSISITTVQAAYNQLVVEGYASNRPQSGYYAEDLKQPSASVRPTAEARRETFQAYINQRPRYRYDLSSFNYSKWKKCMSNVLNEYPALLLSEGDPQGEPMLREEISRYVYNARGVNCTPDQIVISAGTQQLTGHLVRILDALQIRLIATEDPGYQPVQKIFRDGGYSVRPIPVRRDGIEIEKLPENVPCAVYVNPSNQFPTGSVMPIGRRNQLLDWAERNRSLIIEDDYDSELRYFGKPIPSLQGLRENSPVVYLGSFSSTLFAAIRMSYMVLPEKLAEIFRRIKDQYDQTSSKTEQLTLALYMERGYYGIHLKKLRTLYASKLRTALRALERCGTGFLTPLNRSSGIHIPLTVRIPSPLGQNPPAQTNTALPSSGAAAAAIPANSTSSGDAAAEGTATVAGGAATDSVTSENAAAGGATAKTMSPQSAAARSSVDLSRRLCEAAEKLRLRVVPLPSETTANQCGLLFYYNQIPLDEIDYAVEELTEEWKRVLRI